MQKLIHHIARNDTLGGVNEVDVLANLEAECLNLGANELVDSARAYGRFNHYGSSFGADFQHFFHSCYHIAGINLLRELVVGSRHRHDVGVGLLILGGKLDSGFHGSLKQLVEAVLLECGMSGVERSHKFLVIVSTNDFHTV